MESMENCPQSAAVTPTLQEGNFAVMVTPNRSSSAPVADWIRLTSGNAHSDLGSHPHFSNKKVEVLTSQIPCLQPPSS